MPDLSRRRLLAGTAAVAALGAMPARSAVQADAANAEPPDLSGKSFLITGCSSGFGYLGALHYARLGAKVFATMRGTPRPEAEELQRIAEAENLDLAVLRLDVLLDNEVEDAIASVERDLGGGMVDVLVNNAGIVPTGPVEVHDMVMTQKLFDTNVMGYQRMHRAVLPGMRRRGSGLIVNVSSQQGRIIAPGFGLYSASKFAVESMSEQLAYELAPHGIEVTIVQPGGFPTEVGVNRAIYNRELLARAEEIHTAGYPELVAEMPTDPEAQRGRMGNTPDPLMVPQAIAEIAAMKPGSRPLRRPVHPVATPQVPINEVSREVQLGIADRARHGAWMKAALD